VTDPRRVQPFDLRHVRLLEGPLRDAQERNRRYLLSLDPDRLLHTFRLTAGLPSSAEPLGGWEKPTCELRGHFAGHYLSACALAHSATGDEAFKALAEALVAGMGRCQATHGNGYLSAFPEEFIDRVETGRRVWAPWYTLHKILAGLLDVHAHCGTGEALEIASRMAAWVGARVGRLDDSRMQRVLDVEFGGMSEAFWNLYAVTGQAEHRRLAERFEHRAVLDPLAEGRDALRGLHANTQIPKAIGAARAYELTGDPRYHDIASYFWHQVVGRRAYCCGGTSNYECWREGPDRLAAELSAETHENCCTHNLMKLARHLFGWHPEARFADYYERALYSGILPTLHPDVPGAIMYYVPMKGGLFKYFGDPDDTFACCNGTGIESFAKLADSLYFHDDGGLWVNLFHASELTWPEKGVRLRQETRFPEEDRTRLTVEVDKPLEFALRVRIPGWTGQGASVTVNGEPVPQALLPASYAEIRRTWRRGDRVEVRLPMGLRLDRMPDDANLAAIAYGPVVLAGELGTDGMTDSVKTGVGREAGRMNTEGPAMPAPAIVTGQDDPRDWVKPAADLPLTFRTEGVGRPKDVALIPFYRLFGQRYAVYWELCTPDRWALQQAAQPALPEGALDRVVIGDPRSEHEHYFQAYQYEMGTEAGRTWVRSRFWVRYDVALPPDVPIAVRCLLIGQDAAVPFDLYVDGRKVEAAASAPEPSDGLVTVTHRIPEEMTRGRTRVAIALKVPASEPPSPPDDKAAVQPMTPRLAELRIVRDASPHSREGKPSTA